MGADNYKSLSRIVPYFLHRFRLPSNHISIGDAISEMNHRTEITFMESLSLLGARPLLGALLTILTVSICYFFTQLYNARMLFIKKKRMGLVCIRCSYSSFDKSLLITSHTALCTSPQFPLRASPPSQTANGCPAQECPLSIHVRRHCT